MTRPSNRNILLWILFTLAFFYFFEVDFVDAGSHEKLRVQTREGGNGFVIRMRWGVWELWQMKHKAEIKKILPLRHYDPVGWVERHSK